MTTVFRLSRSIRVGVAAIAVSSSLAALAPAPASAGDRGGAVAAGIIGGVALGALAAGALAQPAPPPARRVYVEEEPVYLAPPPPPRRVYVERCATEVRQVWTGYRWIEERERVCN